MTMKYICFSSCPAVAALGLLAFICAGCDRASHPQPATLTMIDTVFIEETDRNFIGEPYSLIARPSGTYLIADLRNATVHEYSAEGKHIRRIGSRGSGPDEFERGPGRLAIDGDTVLFATDGSNVKAIDLRTGEFLWSKFMPGHSVVRSAHKGRVYFNYVDREWRTSVSFVQAGMDSVQRGGPFPWPLGESRIIDEILGFTEITHLNGSDTVAVGMQSSNHVFIGPFEGPFDSIYVPVLARFGARPDLLAQIAEDTATATKILNKQSVPWSIFSLPSRRIAYVVVDAEWVSNSRYVGKMFVSVIDHQTTKVCPDAEVRVSGDPLPQATVRGDTLLVLFQDLVKNVGSGTGTITGIARYFLDTSQCLR